MKSASIRRLEADLGPSEEPPDGEINDIDPMVCKEDAVKRR